MVIRELQGFVLIVKMSVVLTIAVPLTITGSLDAPKFDLDLGTVIRKSLADQLRRRARRLFK